MFLLCLSVCMYVTTTKTVIYWMYSLWINILSRVILAGRGGGVGLLHRTENNCYQWNNNNKESEKKQSEQSRKNKRVIKP